jgi:hypothetical protein
MALKGKKPELVKPRKPHIMITGEAGVGKSTFALNWPNPYYFDTELGITREQYIKKLQASGGAYLGLDEGAQDFDDVIEQIRELATTKHQYKTAIIDSFSKLYNLEMQEAEEGGVSSDFGKSAREADKPTKRLLSWLTRLDMAVLLIAHTKDKWRKEGKELVWIGSTWDGFKKMDYELDLWIEVFLKGSKRWARVRKTRVESFEMGYEFELTYDNFKKLYGASVIDEPPVPIVLASPEQIADIARLIDVMKIPPEAVAKALAKAQAMEIKDLSKDKADEIIKSLNDKLKGVSK